MTTARGASLVVTGATGMVGGLVLRIALDTPAVESVTTIGRRATGLEHDKLREVVHEDFDRLEPIADALAGHDGALFCLGAYTGSVPDELFRKITVDFTLAFARALHAGSPGAVFCLLSGQGADSTEQSRMSFARYKGAAENGLLAQGFARVHIFRPGYIYPVTVRDEPNFSYRMARALWPAVRAVYPNAGISSEDLARAMVHTALHGSGEHEAPVLENRDIRALAAAI